MPFAARAQDRMRHIGLLSALAADNPENQIWVGAFLQGLQQLGWTIGRNVRIDYRLGVGDTELIRKHAANWSRLRRMSSWPMAPRPWQPLLQATRSVPIVFVPVSDPVGAGSSRAWRGRAATPPASPCSNLA